jgi:hypothetical protein
MRPGFDDVVIADRRQRDLRRMDNFGDGLMLRSFASLKIMALRQ